MSNPLEDKLKQLHASLTDALLARIESGDAKPADLMAAAKFLKDNGIDCRPGANPALGRLAGLLGDRAFAGDEEQLLQ